MPTARISARSLEILHDLSIGRVGDAALPERCNFRSCGQDLGEEGRLRSSYKEIADLLSSLDQWWNRFAFYANGTRNVSGINLQKRDNPEQAFCMTRMKTPRPLIISGGIAVRADLGGFLGDNHSWWRLKLTF